MSGSGLRSTGLRETGLRDAFLVDGCRTPFLKAATGFVDLMSYQLGAATIRGLLERTGVGPDQVDRVILGATVVNARTTNVAREAALDAGLPATVPAVTVTAAGASATVAICQGVDLIRTGQADVVIASASDCVSDPPIGYSRAMRKKLLGARRLRSLGDKLRFALSLRPWDFLPDIPDIREFSTGQTMGQYTEQLAAELDISRQDQDAYAARSHQLAAAHEQQLQSEIVPVRIAESGVDEQRDNGIRPETSAENLARLRPAFARQGTLTAGNSSYLTDGASAVMLMSEEKAEQLGIAPKARLVATALTAHDPKDELLLGPVFATPKALALAGLDFSAIDVFEIHEAFAAQILAVLQLMASDDFARQHLDRDSAVGEISLDRLNAWGGSLAIGNPFAPNGARLLTTAAHRLHEENANHALVATCAGGGLGHALILER